ncbi:MULTISPECIES: GntP family permease [Actinoalloteichus]|uniref:H+/gluconate symporter family protein n=1 Tax=Actinoalloteichus fjordicus TaxID=1612552 RepID=A0AAC9PQA9_9PSEU|nr:MULTISPECIES: SLC13 family permease [Actinoalloteichus]APU12818.1 H+/gluconate symporter family protein [Actinoalloteichus fjordicus]APU18790.1 H+/gluconate symporter family protein [Actinoalloteichus sp. GBA129-24]
MQSTAWMLTAAGLAIGLLLLLVIKFKFQPFVALLIASIGFGLSTGMQPVALVDLMVDQMGGALGQVALVIGLGAIFGEVLQRAGAAERLATTLIDRFSDRNVAWGLGFAGFLVSIAVFIDVAIVILVPMLYSIARRTGRSLLFYGIPLCAGLSVTHTFIPPTPGPIATAGIMNADLGLVILFGVICGLPAMLVAGPIFGRFISKRIFVPVPEDIAAPSPVVAGGRSSDGAPAAATPDADSTSGSGQSAGPTSPGSPSPAEEPVRELPSFLSVVGALLLPLVLILGGTTGSLLLQEGSAPHTALAFIGHPVIALLLTCLYTLYFFGVRRGSSGDELQKMATRALAPAGVIILITGAGGVFGGFLVESGLGEVLADAMQEWNIPIVLFGFLTSALIRISQGSGTVAMITGATLTAPLAESMDLGGPMLALTCIAIACGGTAFSHVNDSGFWMANRYFGMSVADTLRSWTVMKTAVGLTGLAVVLILSQFVS